LLAGCDGQPSEPQVDGILLARGGGGKPPKVDEADPPSAPQDTTLDVRVLGSNFDDGSTVEYTIDGVPQAQVRTNGVTFVNESELVSNVTIDLDALVDLYDVEVMTSRGKKGIGADKFQVVEKGGGPRPPDPSIIETFRDADTDNIQSDGAGVYEDGVCGVSATFNGNDARLHLDKIHPRDRAACGPERTISVAFTNRADGSPPASQDADTVGAFFLIVEDVELVTEADGTVLTYGTIGGAGCGLGLRFDPNEDPQSDWLQVTKNPGPGETWTIATQPNSDDVAVCLSGKRNAPPPSYYHMPFQVTVQLR
jgi:hypothetical protein